jgi:predicted SprT family Zn-dependent metalloprotease
MTNTELLGILSTVRQHLVSMKHLKANKGHDIMFQAVMRKVNKHATDELIRADIAEVRATMGIVAH